MTKQRERVKRRNMIAHDLLTSGLYKPKKTSDKTKYTRKPKHRKLEDA